MQYRYLIFLFFLGQVSFGQIAAYTLHKSQYPDIHTFSFFLQHNIASAPDFSFVHTQHETGLLIARPVPTVNHLPGIFCRLEHRLGKGSRLAPRFRLGSLQYTEWMEGKGVLGIGY